MIAFGAANDPVLTWLFGIIVVGVALDVLVSRRVRERGGRGLSPWVLLAVAVVVVIAAGEYTGMEVL